MRHSTLAICIILGAFLASAALAEGQGQTISPEQAAQAVGHQATVCGLAASVHFAARSRGQPTFINLGRAYPNQIFTIVIWGSDRGRFHPEPEAWQGKRICVTGLVKRYRGIPEVIVYGPDQIQSGGK